MRDVGLKLREAREAREMSLEDVARITRVPRATLEAIEEGDRTRMPPAVYVRGFVRAFATTVGLDPTETARALTSTDERIAADGPGRSGLSTSAGRGVGRPGTGRSGSRQLDTSDGARFERLLGIGPDGGRRTGMASSHVLLLLLAAGMFLAGWLMVGTHTSREPVTASPGSLVPAIQDRVDGVSVYTSSRHEVDDRD